MNNQEVLRQLGVFPCTIIGVVKKEASSFKGKQYPAKYAVTFESKDKRLIDGNFKLPFTEHKWDKKLMEQLLSACGVEKISELKGKDVAVFIEPYEWQGKTRWNPKGYYKLHYLKDPSAILDEALDTQDSLNKKDSMDEIPF